MSTNGRSPVGLRLVCEVVDTLDGVSLPNRIRQQLWEWSCCDREHSTRWGVSVRLWVCRLRPWNTVSGMHTIIWSPA